MLIQRYIINLVNTYQDTVNDPTYIYLRMYKIIPKMRTIPLDRKPASTQFQRSLQNNPWNEEPLFDQDTSSCIKGTQNKNGSTVSDNSCTSITI